MGVASNREQARRLRQIEDQAVEALDQVVAWQLVAAVREARS